MNIYLLKLDDYDEYSHILYGDDGDGGDGNSESDEDTEAANIAGVEAGAGGSFSQSVEGIANVADEAISDFGTFSSVADAPTVSGGAFSGFQDIAQAAAHNALGTAAAATAGLAETAISSAAINNSISGNPNVAQAYSAYSEAVDAISQATGVGRSDVVADISSFADNPTSSFSSGLFGGSGGVAGQGATSSSGGAAAGPGTGGGGGTGGEGDTGGDDDLEQALLAITAEPTRDPTSRRRTTRDTGAVGSTGEEQTTTSTPERDARLVQRDPRPQTRSGNQVRTNELTGSPRSTFKGFEDFVSGTGAVGDTGALFRQIEDTSTLSHGQWNFLGFNPYLDDDRIETKERRPYLGVS